MITLRESVSISAPFEKLDAWADNFEEEFVKWSPLHLECQLFDKGINKGDRVRFFEIVMGLDYDVTGTIIESERDKDHFKISFESDKKTAIITFDYPRLPICIQGDALYATEPMMQLCRDYHWEYLFTQKGTARNCWMKAMNG